MGRRVLVERHAVGGLGDDHAVTRYHGPERAAAVAHTILAQRYGAPHQFFFFHIVFIVLQGADTAVRQPAATTASHLTIAFVTNMVD